MSDPKPPIYLYRPATRQPGDEPTEPGVSKGYIVFHEGPPEVGKPVETFAATTIVDPDGDLYVDVDWDNGQPGRITDG